MYYFIVNPNSRSGKGALIWKELRRTLRQKHVSYKAVFTEYRGHAVKLAASVTAKASPEHPVYLIAVGGDGTIQEVLSGVKDLSCIYFGYIPTGSGNDFCRSMQLPQDPHEALNCILKRKHIASMDVPVISIKGRKSHFAISCGIGFDAAVCHEVGVTPMKKVLNRVGLGKLVYLFVALKQLLFLKPVPVTLRMDEERIYPFHKVYFAAVMNQKYEGGGFKFCPDASPSDGYLDVIVVDGLINDIGTVGIQKPFEDLILQCIFSSVFRLHSGASIHSSPESISSAAKRSKYSVLSHLRYIKMENPPAFRRLFPFLSRKNR